MLESSSNNSGRSDGEELENQIQGALKDVSAKISKRGDGDSASRQPLGPDG